MISTEIWMWTVTILFNLAMWGWSDSKNEIVRLKREKLENLEEYTEKLEYYKIQVQELRTKFPEELIKMVERIGKSYKED